MDFKEFLRDPIWQGIVAIIGIVAAIAACLRRLKRSDLNLYHLCVVITRTWNSIQQNWRHLAALVIMLLISLIGFNWAFGDWLHAIPAFFAVIFLLAAMHLMTGLRAQPRSLRASEIEATWSEVQERQEEINIG